MRTLAVKAFIILITISWYGVSKADDSLGRLFLTPDQRTALEKLRYQKPVVVKIPEIIAKEPAISETETVNPEIGNIEVNGLVYRMNGKSTAWINRVSSYEGDLANEYIQVDAGNIKPDDVEIVIPINDTKVNLKAGESFNPEAGEVKKFSYQSR
jgi:hypothetical protein